MPWVRINNRLELYSLREPSIKRCLALFILEQTTKREQETYHHQGNPDNSPDNRQADDHTNNHEHQSQDYSHDTASELNNPADEFP